MVAGGRRADVLSQSLDAGDRAHAQTRVLVNVLVLNLVVASAKIAFGAWSGAVSILSDGVHSLADSISNVVGLVGVRAARQPADPSHPYGHRKFETLAAVAILMFLLIALIQIVEAAVARLLAPAPVTVNAISFVVMLGTLAINLVVVRYESGAALRLRSEILAADAHHTRSDVLTSLGVIVALVGVRRGWTFLDPLVALAVAGFIGHAVYEIARDASNTLADRAVFGEDEIRRVVASMPEVQGCHQIRTRGSADHAFLDLHVWFRPDMRLDEAHARSHEVKDRLMAAFPTLRDVVIHIEPPPKAGGVRS
jgi:cation diffusion facilitator family transporter